MNIFKIVRSCYFSSRANDFASKRDFERAYEALERAYSELGVSVPADIAPADWNILASQIAIGIRDGDLALRSCKVALNQINLHKSRYRGEDKKYMEAFCRAIIQYCVAWRDGVAPKIDAPGYDIGKVSSYIRTRFVIPSSGSFLEAG